MSKVYIMVLQAMQAMLAGSGKFYIDSSVGEADLNTFKECLIESGLKMVPTEDNLFTIEDL